MSAPVVDLMAVAMCDAFFAAITPPDPTRWRTARADQRMTFQGCASAALDAGRRAKGQPAEEVEDAVARAVSDAFWAHAEPPPRWLRYEVGPPQVREFFRLVGRAGMEAARRIRETRQAA